MAIVIKPLLNIEEHNIVPFFAFSGSIPQNKGVLVTVQGSGWSNPINPMVPAYNLATQSPYGSNFSQSQVGNAYLPVWTVPQTVALSTTGDRPLGVLFYDVVELGFQNWPLRFDPVRRAERQAVLSGEGVPVVRAGMFLISGINVSTLPSGVTNPTNSGVKADVNGGYVVTSNTDPLSVGQVLGAPDRDGFILVDIDCRR